MKRAGACIATLLLGANIGCQTTHTIRRPAQSAGYLEIGPVRDQYGVDVGPLLAEQMHDSGLADAHVVETPSGTSNYLTGITRIEHDEIDPHQSAWPMALIISGSIFTATGVGLVGAVAAVESSDPASADTYGSTHRTLNSIGYGFLGVGLPLLALGTLLAIAEKPGSTHAKVEGTFAVRRPDRSQVGFEVHDKSTVRFNRSGEVGDAIFDGLGRGVANGVLQTSPLAKPQP